jgi:uncharacterized protein DUF4336
MNFAQWRVLEHGPLEKLEENVWAVEGTVPGMPMKRRMTVVRLADGSLVVHNGICLEDEAQRTLDAWGPVRFVVVPNGWHRIDAPAYAARYPDARVVCPDPARKLVAKRVRVDGNLSLLPADPTLVHAPLDGSSIAEHVLTVRSGPRATLVFNDTLFNLPKLAGFKGWVYGLIGSTGAPKVTPLMRVVSVRDRAALRRHLEGLAATPGLERVIPGHGSVVEGADAARSALRTAAAGL